MDTPNRSRRFSLMIPVVTFVVGVGTLSAGTLEAGPASERGAYVGRYADLGAEAMHRSGAEPADEPTVRARPQRSPGTARRADVRRYGGAREHSEFAAVEMESATAAGRTAPATPYIGRRADAPHRNGHQRGWRGR